MDTLVAHTQYTDMRGTSAVDDAHDVTLEDYLRETKRISDNEFLVAISFYHSEGSTFARAITASLDDRIVIADASAKHQKVEPKSLRAIRLEMSLTQFFKFFKRFDITLVEDGLIGALDEVNIDNLPE